MKKWLIGLFVVCFFALLLISILVATERGTQWILQSIVEQSEQEIEISGISGTLLSALSIDHLTYNSCGFALSIKELDIDWQFRGLFARKLTIDNLLVDSILASLSNDCNEPASESFQLPTSLTLPIDIELGNASFNRVRIDQHNKSPQVIKNIVLNVQVNDSQLKVQVENIDYMHVNAQSTLRAHLQYPYSVQGDVQWQFQQEQQIIQGDAKIKGTIEALDVQHYLQEPYKVDTTLNVKNILSGLTFTSNTNWQQVIVTLENSQVFTLKEGRIGVNGSLNSIKYQFNSLVDAPLMSNIKLTGQGGISRERINIDSFALEHEKTQLLASGEVEYTNDIAANLDIVGKELDPSLIYTDYPGKLQLHAQVDYFRQDQQNRLNVRVQELIGTLRDYPLEGSGSFTSDLEQIQFDRARLSVGNNHITANGTIAKLIDVHANVDAPQIEQFLQDAKGDLRGTISIQGSQNHPSLNALLKSNKLQVKDQIYAQKLKLNVHSDGASDQVIEAALTSQELKVREDKLQNVHVSLYGTVAQHRLQAALKSSYGDLSLSADGTFRPDEIQWHGDITSIELNETMFGDWKNKDSVHVKANAREQSIDALCMAKDVQSVCLEYSKNDAAQHAVNIVLENVELSHLQSIMKEHGQVNGQASGVATLFYDNWWTGEITLNAHHISLSPTQENGIDETLKFEKIDATMQLDEQSQLQLEFASNIGSGSAHFVIDSLLAVDVAQIRQGNILLNLPDLKFLNPYLKEVILKQGVAQLDINIEGSLQSPSIVGQGSLDELHFYIPELGTEYQNAQLSFNATDLTKIDIKGNVSTDNTYLNVQGWISLQDPSNVHYQISVAGKNFLIVDTVDVKASITPDLSIEGDAKSATLYGAIQLPILHVQLKELPDDIVSVSKDEIIIEDTEEENVREEKFAVTGVIDLTIGEDAFFNGYGLQTDLNGKLKITLDKHQPVVGHGLLSMENASYTKYGQALDIDKGKLIFSGPLDDPSLDIHVKRSAGDVTVTMLIGGKADNPTTKLISDPPLSEANKLSYLLTGRGVNDLSSGEGKNLSNVAIALGLNQSSSIVQEIGSKFGLDTLSIQAGDNGLQSSSLLLGKHLSPKLYISYAKDLFSALGAIQMNYRLTDHLSLEVESGARQTVDLIYSISKE